MRIAILGATSQIARDLICAFSKESQKPELLLYARNISSVEDWLSNSGLGDAGYPVNEYSAYGREPHDAVINFVGVGDPRRAAEMGASIFEVTQQYDDLILEQLRAHPERRYIFLSSGAAYGDSFDSPVTASTQSRIAINAITPQDYYGVAKLCAEARHRAHKNLAITDIRVFNYFSRTQDLSARFFITDILRAIRDKQVLKTSGDYIVRDVINPSDFLSMIKCILNTDAKNCSVDCYTLEAIDKPSLLKNFQVEFGLRYEVVDLTDSIVVNATKPKPYYYSLNHNASEFGYYPRLSSWEGIKLESMAILA